MRLRDFGFALLFVAVFSALQSIGVYLTGGLP